MEKFCSECGKEIKDEFNLCPYCGNEIEKTQMSNKDLEKVDIIKEKVKEKYGIITFILSFVLFIIIISSIKYAKDVSNSYTFIELHSKLGTKYVYLVLLFGFNIFLAFILSISSYITGKISKLFYALSIGILILLNNFINSRGFIILDTYIFMFAITAILLVINRKTYLKINSKLVDKNNIDEINKIKNMNDIVTQKFNSRKYNRIIQLVSIVCLLIVCVITYSVANNNKNLKPKNIDVNQIVSLSQLKEGKFMVVEVTNEFINVRSESSTKSNKIGQVFKGEKYVVIDLVNGSSYKWYKIKDENGIEGFIANPKNGKTYLSLSIKETNEIKSDNIHVLDAGNHEDIKDEIDEGVEEIVEKPIKNNNNINNNNNNNNNKPVIPKENTTPSNNNEVKQPENIETVPIQEEQQSTVTEEPKQNQDKTECLSKKQKLKEDYERELSEAEETANNKIERAETNVGLQEDYCASIGATNSYSYYSNLVSNYQQQLNDLQVQYQRAAMDTSQRGQSQAYYLSQEINNKRTQISEAISRRNCASTLADLKEDLKALKNEKSMDIRDIKDAYQHNLSLLDC